MVLDNETKQYIDEKYELLRSVGIAKYGDTPTDAKQLTPKFYVDDSVSSLSSAIFSGFGGNGSDGSVSGTATVNLSSQNYAVKQYTTVTIPAGQTVEFSNAANDGTVVIWKVQGDVNILGTLDLRNVGAIFGAGGGVPSEEAAGSGSPGASGTKVSSSIMLALSSIAGLGGQGGHQSIGGTLVGGTPGAAPSDRVFYTFTTALDEGKVLAKRGIYVAPGAGGGGGGGGGDNNSGDTGNTAGTGASGGRGGGALYMEVAGNLSFSGSIIASGGDGSNGNQPVVGGPPDQGTYGCGGGGGGGSAGMVVILARNVVDETGIIVTSGGSGGNGGDSTLGTNNASCDPGGGAGGGGAASFLGPGGGGGLPADRDQNGGNGSVAGADGAGGGGGGGAGCRRTGSHTGGTGGAGGASYGGLIIEIG